MAAGHIAAAGEVLDALVQTSTARTRHTLRDAARAFERASRSHVHALRQAARALVHTGTALGRGEDGATTAMAIDMLFFLITAAGHWHAKKGHAQQAAAAHRAAEHLRAAYRTAAAHPLNSMYRRGRQLSRTRLDQQSTVVHQAIPELAGRILAEPGWYALAATLTDAETAGHDPAALLAEATARRELGTADSVSDVLVWRLRRVAELPADTNTTIPGAPTTPAPAVPPSQRNSRRPRHQP